MSNLESDGLAFKVAEPSEPFAKSLQEWIGLRSGGQPADARRPARLLRPGSERRGEEPGSTSKERSALHHSITWSARASSDCGMVRPSAFAVFRLMTRWYLEACSTGRSAGLAPLRILSM